MGESGGAAERAPRPFRHGLELRCRARPQAPHPQNSAISGTERQQDAGRQRQRRAGRSPEPPEPAPDLRWRRRCASERRRTRRSRRRPRTTTSRRPGTSPWPGRRPARRSASAGKVTALAVLRRSARSSARRPTSGVCAVLEDRDLRVPGRAGRRIVRRRADAGRRPAARGGRARHARAPPTAASVKSSVRIASPLGRFRLYTARGAARFHQRTERAIRSASSRESSPSSRSVTGPRDHTSVLRASRPGRSRSPSGALVEDDVRLALDPGGVLAVDLRERDPALVRRGRASRSGSGPGPASAAAAAARGRPRRT